VRPISDENAQRSTLNVNCQSIREQATDSELYGDQANDAF